MSENGPLGAAEKVLSSAHRHGHGLREVNEKLADLVSSLRDQKERLARYSPAGAPPASGGPAEAPPGTGAPARPLGAELALAREAMELARREHEEIRERLAEIQEANRRLCEEYAALQDQNSDLVNLYVAVQRLYGAADRADVLAAIQEIVANLVGSEELAVFELSGDGNRLVPAHAFGVEPPDPREIAVGSGTVGRVAAEGVAFVADEADAAARPDPPHLTACIPLELGGRVRGALAIYGLLGHKSSLGSLDRELLALLQKHAARALRASALGERTEAGLGEGAWSG
ncbi:MAG TPA: GAF domain-containing protein [Anaeromyxobacter sp.]